ncbi:MAG TPA: UDP-glucose 4-epimerase GalE [Candidatus Nanoarchaeia archaeon]|nr:UDP-glucose 4-epimerase GalE [Candidatus Nanoarchaeia archaeon]
MTTKILVTGGSGYIGSNTVKLLLDVGYEVIVCDKNKLPENLIKSTAQNKNLQFIDLDLSNSESIDKLMTEQKIDSVIHFAGYIEAGESMRHPEIFFRNNLVNGLNLLQAMIKHNIKQIIFSSSAAVYKAKEKPLTEEDLTEPANVYGETKLIFENILKWFDQIYGLKYVSLRYFNAAGASSGLGENHIPETHLIPILLQSLLQGSEIKIFGTDYNTPDGTCIRDYIHVQDLAKAHLLSLQYLSQADSAESKIYNVGTGAGHSVKEVILAVEQVTGQRVKAVESPRRRGDPPILVADSAKIKRELNWIPQHNLHSIIQSAWEWHRSCLGIQTFK